MKPLFFSVAILLSIISFAQQYFRSGIFLHHSTGQYIWGPNPDGTSTTTIPDQINLFNTSHNFTGNAAFSLSEEWWSPGDNEWYTQHEFFIGNTAFTNINDYMAANKIIVVKSCFPSSSIDSWGSASDTLSPDYKSVYNYKWHWRNIVRVMQNHPEVFFAIWTNAPLEASSTITQEAALAKSFCKWAKDTLAQGLDTEFGIFPPNVYVFDFFNKLTGSNGIMLNQFRTDVYDSHPNGSATDLVAPQFVNEIFNAILIYESTLLNLKQNDFTESGVSIFPNPSNEKIRITLFSDKENIINLAIYNISGQAVKSVESENPTAGFFSKEIDIKELSNGTYFLKIQTFKNIFFRKIIIQ